MIVLRVFNLVDLEVEQIEKEGLGKWTSKMVIMVDFSSRIRTSRG